MEWFLKSEIYGDSHIDLVEGDIKGTLRHNLMCNLMYQDSFPLESNNNLQFSSD